MDFYRKIIFLHSHSKSVCLQVRTKLVGKKFEHAISAGKLINENTKYVKISSLDNTALNFSDTPYFFN